MIIISIISFNNNIKESQDNSKDGKIDVSNALVDINDNLKDDSNNSLKD